MKKYHKFETQVCKKNLKFTHFPKSSPNDIRFPMVCLLCAPHQCFILLAFMLILCAFARGGEATQTHVLFVLNQLSFERKRKKFSCFFFRGKCLMNVVKLYLIFETLSLIKTYFWLNLKEKRFWENKASRKFKFYQKTTRKKYPTAWKYTKGKEF